MVKQIQLDNFANGALAERMNQALQEVLENISDPNTDYSAKRKLTLEMSFSTSEDRELTEVKITAKTKLAPRESVTTKILIDRTLEGEVIGTEFRKQVPGQLAMKVDENGEIFEEETTELQGLQIVK